MTIKHNNQGANQARHAERLARIAPHRDAIIADLQQDELSVDRISKKYGLTREAVISVGNDIGMDLRARAGRVQVVVAAIRFAVDEDAIVEDLEDLRLTSAAISARHHITPRRLSRIAAKHGVDMRERGKNLTTESDYTPGGWVVDDTLCGAASIDALRLPLNRIAEALKS